MYSYKLIKIQYNNNILLSKLELPFHIAKLESKLYWVNLYKFSIKFRHKEPTHSPTRFARRFSFLEENTSLIPHSARLCSCCCSCSVPASHVNPAGAAWAGVGAGSGATADAGVVTRAPG